MSQVIVIEALMSTIGAVLIVIIFYEISFFPLYARSTHTIL